MYCSKCGKQIDYDSPLCKECVEAMAENSAQQAPQQPPVQPTYTAQPVYPTQTVAQNGNPRMRGFGKALTSTIMGFIGYFFAVFAMSFGAIEEEAGIVLFIIALPLTILPFIFGLNSISTFRSTPRNEPKPVVTLVFGIIGLSISALSMLFLFLALMVLMSL